jgi:hypothetical protein
MSTTIETLKSYVTTLANTPLLLSVSLGLIILGWLLKSLPAFPNKYIPATVVVVGGVLGFFIVPLQGPADWAFKVSNPEAADVIRRVCIGVTLGVLAWMAQKFAFRYVEDWLKQKFGSGDTTFIQKPPESGK